MLGLAPGMSSAAAVDPGIRVTMVVAVGAAAACGASVTLFGLGPLAAVLVAVGAVAASALGALLLGSRPAHTLARAARGLGDEPATGAGPTDLEDARLAASVASFLERARSDLSRRQRARHEAETADRLETRFLTHLSHELKTPLNSVLGFSQVLLDQIDGPLNESQREDVTAIHGAGEHLSALVGDVLDLAALESRRVSLAREPTDVGPIIEDVARLLLAQRRGKPVEIRTSVDDHLPRIDADPKRIRQIVMNLGTNALKFTERGHVLLEAAPEGGGIRLTVRDTGPGIPRTELESIFREFTQAPTPRRGSQGTGLGLAIAKHLTELHGGEISVESTLGVGSVFTVLLGRSAD